jgi:hypothetical protein
MLAVAAQLPAAVLTNELCGTTGRAPSRSGLEPEPEASAGATSASNAQVADPADLMRTKKPPLLAWMNEPRISRKTLRKPYKTVKPFRNIGPVARVSG